jgi:hypothetical protein
LITPKPFWNPKDVPNKNFKRLLKAVEECPTTAGELQEKVNKETDQKTFMRKLSEKVNALLRRGIS